MIPFHEDAWRAHFIAVEGHANHFYLDGKGIVTIGIGCQVFDPTTLVLLHKSDSRTATPGEIMDEYRTVRMLPALQRPAFYDKVCRLVLPEADIATLFHTRLLAFIQTVEESIVRLDGFPELAALVLVDMAFNLGVEGLERKFPKFLNAFRMKDWKIAALESKREGVQNERNAWARQSLESLITFSL
jgi:GH24 family phage-related lysozyme (muramidase)